MQGGLWSGGSLGGSFVPHPHLQCLPREVVHSTWIVPSKGGSETDTAKSKRGRREGDGKKKRHDNLRHFATFYDNFRLFIPLT